MKNRRILAGLVIVFGVLFTSFTFYIYQVLFTPNVLVDKEDQLFPIYKGTTFEELQHQLYDQRIVNDLLSFSFLAKIMDLDENLRPGLYMLHKDMSNLEAVRLLRSGSQFPIKLTFNSVRKVEELAPKLAASLALDSADFAPLLTSDSVARAYGFDSLTFICMFLPNTYEVYWTATPTEILNRMKKEYDRFWTSERLQKAKDMGLTQTEVITLASIVDAETNHMDEAPAIAGVYMNRLKNREPLQADPTLVYALGDYSIRRILKKDREIDSPYNTYLHTGLPPGPINMPSIAAIDAVLNYDHSDYYFFCAKEDFSGYHVFAKNLNEHLNNARRFQRALNQQNIYR